MHDIIAISTVVKFPDLFVAITFNSKWEEINDVMVPGQQATGQPYICARIFRINLRTMIAYPINKEVFGDVEAHVCVIKF